MAGLGHNTPRLGIPRVNQNPQAPHLKQALGNRIRAPRGPISQRKPLTFNPKGESSTTAYANGMGATPAPAAPAPAPATGSAAAISNAAPPASSPPPSTQRFAIPTWTPKAAGEPDPRDATYWANLAKLKAADEGEYNKTLETQANEDAGYGLALKEAIQARGVQEHNLGGEALRSGLASSGWLDRTQGEQVRTYTNERASASMSHEQETHAREVARNALIEGFPVDVAGLLAEAGARLAQREENENENGEPESPAASPVAPGAAGSAPVGGKFQFYPGPNQLPGAKPKGKGKGSGNGGTTAPAKPGPVKAALANKKKAK
jgi:hypothetical protein